MLDNPEKACQRQTL